MTENIDEQLKVGLNDRGEVAIQFDAATDRFDLSPDLARSLARTLLRKAGEAERTDRHAIVLIQHDMDGHATEIIATRIRCDDVKSDYEVSITAPKVGGGLFTTKVHVDGFLRGLGVNALMASLLVRIGISNVAVDKHGKEYPLTNELK